MFTELSSDRGWGPFCWSTCWVCWWSRQNITLTHTAASESHRAPTLPSKKRRETGGIDFRNSCSTLPLVSGPPLPPPNRCVTWRSLRRAATRPCRGCATSPRTEVRSRLGGWLCTVPRCTAIGQQLGNAVQYGGNGLCSDAVPWKRGYNVEHEAMWQGPAKCTKV